jgi:hypothetical protein
MKNGKMVSTLVVLVSFVIIVMMGIFPPWSYVDESKVAHSMGYAPIWKAPINHSSESASFMGFKLQVNLQSQTANTIDFAKLMMQIAIVALVSGGTVALLKRTAST